MTLAARGRERQGFILKPFGGQGWAKEWASLGLPVVPGLAHNQAQASASARLGPPLSIREVAELIGCSPWTVRQTLIPRGLPHFRFKASGRLTFYRDQVIRWIESQQQKGGLK